MIPFRPYNVMVPKFKIEDKIAGGIATIHRLFSQVEVQDDDYLVAIGGENATDVRSILGQLMRLGLSFDEKLERSEDFAVLAKEGIWWKVEWLVYNANGSWFIADVEAPVEKI